MRSVFPPAVIPLLLMLSGATRVLALDLEIIGLDGVPVRGRLVRVLPEITLATPDGESVLAWNELLALKPLDVDLSDEPATEKPPLRFTLGDGSTFGARIDSATEHALVLQLNPRQTCRLDVSRVCEIRSARAGSEALARLDQVAAEANDADDAAVVQRNTRVIVLRGAVRAIDPRRVVFAWKQRELPLPWDRIAGLRFARPVEREAPCTVRLHNGDRFSGRVIAGDEAALTLESDVFEQLELSWSRIDRIECRSSRMIFLSDVVEARYEFTPFFQKRWDYARDQTLTGQPIRLAGKQYPKGITMHSRSSLAFTLDRRVRRFAAVASIVDDMANRGNVTLAVTGDGRVLWEARNVRGGETPRDVLVDVTGVRVLTLHVDYGEDLDLSDHVCWAMARLIR